MLELKSKEIFKGLPNIGNTCFLNSAIQFLYSATSFRNQLLSSTQQNLTEIAKALRDVFTVMSLDKSNEEKRQKLFAFTKILRNYHDGYGEFTQQDSNQFLMMILGEIDKGLTEKFCIIYQTRCKCHEKKQQKQKLISIDYNIAKAKLECIQCEQSCQFLFKVAPKYLICLGNKKTPGEELVCYENTEPKMLPFRYRLLSKIIYYGTGGSGHYIAACRINQSKQFICFNDNYLESYQRHWNSPVTVFLYELISEKQYFRLNPIKITDNFKNPQFINEVMSRCYQKISEKILKNGQSLSQIEADGITLYSCTIEVLNLNTGMYISNTSFEEIIFTVTKPIWHWLCCSQEYQVKIENFKKGKGSNELRIINTFGGSFTVLQLINQIERCLFLKQIEIGKMQVARIRKHEKKYNEDINPKFDEGLLTNWRRDSGVSTKIQYKDRSS